MSAENSNDPSVNVKRKLNTGWIRCLWGAHRWVGRQLGRAYRREAALGREERAQRPGNSTGELGAGQVTQN